MTDEQLLACTASRWQGDPGRCRWCDAELPKGRRRWCSDGCAHSFARNHWWTAARHAALRRDGRRCVRCGAAPGEPPGNGVSLEVHHVTPILGRHAETGCHHHLDGLETLCARNPAAARSCHQVAHHGEREPRHEQLGLEAA